MGVLVFNLILVVALRDREGAPTLASLIPFVVMLMAFGLLIVVSAAFAYRRLPPERRVYAWRFFPTHIEADAPLASGRLEWALFVEVRETSRYFLFFVDRAICHTLPKRCFADPTEIDRLRAFCIERLGKKARMRSARTAPM